MTRHIVARTTEIPPGGNKVVDVEGRDIVVFHVNGEFFALLNRCPHEGAPLDKAACVARLTSPEPGIYQRSRVGELLRCPWHGWEFDMRNGQSWFDPTRVKVRTYPVVIEDGETLAKGPYVAETFPVHIEDSYVIVETDVSRGSVPLAIFRIGYQKMSCECYKAAPDGGFYFTGCGRCRSSRCAKRPSA